MAAAAPRERVIQLLRPPGTDGVGIFRVGADDKAVFYTFWELPCDIGGRGFAVHRLGLGSLYHVRVASARDCSCECLGFLRHGRCKHVVALLKLVENGTV
jgi:hypothetical protein